MPYTIVAPYVGFPLKVDAEDFSEAAKKAIRLNQELQIMSMIINDHTNNMRMLANVDYYNQGGRRKAGVKMSKTKALGYQGYPSLSPTIIVGMSSDSDVSPYLLPFGPLAVGMPGGPAIVAGPAGTGLAAVPSGRYGPYGPGIPVGAVPFYPPFSLGDSIESLEKKVKDLTASIAGKDAALATTGISASDTDKYTRERAKLAEQLASASAKLAELKAKKAAK